MKKVKNNSKDRVVLYALEGGKEAPYVVPPFATVLVPDAAFSSPAPPSASTVTLWATGFAAEFPLGEDIDESAGVVVSLPGRHGAPSEFKIQERPGQITFPKPIPGGLKLEITYTNWANDEYVKRGIISVS